MFNIVIILFAQYLFLLSLAIAILYFLKTKRSIKIKLLILTSIAFPLSYLIARISGYFINDPRPFVVEHITPLIPHAADNGFPSDHMLLTMTIASVVFVYNRRLGIILTVIAVCVGIARIMAQIHHFYDILGSIVISVGATYISVLLIKFIHKRLMTKSTK